MRLQELKSLTMQEVSDHPAGLDVSLQSLIQLGIQPTLENYLDFLYPEGTPEEFPAEVYKEFPKVLWDQRIQELDPSADYYDSAIEALDSNPKLTVEYVRAILNIYGFNI